MFTYWGDIDGQPVTVISLSEEEVKKLLESGELEGRDEVRGRIILIQMHGG